MIQNIKDMAKISKWKDVLESDPFSLKGTSGEQLIKFLLYSEKRLKPWTWTFKRMYEPCNLSPYSIKK